MKALGASRQSELGSKATVKTEDSRGRLTHIFEPDGNGKPAFLTDINYDDAGRVTRITQHGTPGDISRVRTFTYDARAHVLSATSPEAGFVGYTYDDRGNLATKTDALSHTTSYTWDAKNRLVKKTYTDGTPASVFDYSTASPNHTSYTVSPIGISASRGYSYNTQGQLSAISVQASGSKASYTVGYTYDSAGHIDSIVYPDGRTLHQRWAKGGLLHSVTDGSSVFFSKPEYSLPSRNIKQATLGNGAVVAHGYDGHHRLVQLTVKNGPQTLVDESFTYTSNGSLSKTTDNRTSAASVQYTYDQLNRVTSASGAVQQSFLYDAFGNGASAENGVASRVFNEHNRITGGEGVTYDEAGRVTFDGVHRYAYNGEGLIRSVDEDQYTYTYDAEGNRIQKTLPDGKHDYVWVNGQLLAERSPNGTWTDYIYVDGERLASVQKNTTRADQVTYFVNAPLGVERTALTQNGSVATSGRFGPFGQLIGGDKAATLISFSD